jgi:exodeoxyribonuclease VII small subunit
MAADAGPSSVSAGDGELGYAAAMAELESILAELEGDDLDVDALARRVARAAELIGWARNRIVAARAEVDQIVADLDPS